MQTYIPDEDKMERLQQLADEAGVPLGVFLSAAIAEQKRKFAALVQQGRDDFEQGRTVADTPEFWEQMKTQGIANHQAGTPIRDEVKP